MSDVSAFAARGLVLCALWGLSFGSWAPSVHAGPASLSSINAYYGDVSDRTLQPVDAGRTARVEAWLVADWFGDSESGESAAVVSAASQAIAEEDQSPRVRRYLESLGTEAGQQIVTNPLEQIAHHGKSYGIDSDLFVAATADRAHAKGPSGVSPFFPSGQFGSYWSPDSVKRVMGVNEDILDTLGVADAVPAPAPASDFKRDLTVIFDQSTKYGGRAFVTKRRLAAGVRRFLLVDNVDISPYSNRVALSLTSWMEDVERHISDLAGSNEFVSQWSQYVVAPLSYETRIKVLNMPGIERNQSTAEQMAQRASDGNLRDRNTSPAVLGAFGIVNYSSDAARRHVPGGGRRR